MKDQVRHTRPFVSVIIPCRNEEKYIGKVLDTVVAQDYPKDLMEVIVVDGASDDKTKEIIQQYAERYDIISILSNPEKVVPFALNRAIRMARGSVILRMDAHAVYPTDYVSALVAGLSKYHCENTGGMWITEPGDDSMQALAIAEATSHPFGIGNAYYRLRVKNPKKVDTVPFGCYQREVFDKIGLFDEDLVRNQDDEFNARLIKNGGSIFLLPHVKIRYYCRCTYGKIASMFYQYGYYKPLVSVKLGAPATLRQFAPPVFVFIFTLTAILGIFYPSFFYVFTGIAGLYLLAALVVSLVIAIHRKKPFKLIIYLLPAFPVIHFSYGSGYLAGTIYFVLFRRRADHSDTGITR